MADYILGIDIGTSSCKAAVFDKNGNVIAAKSEDYKVYYPKEGYAEQKPEEWWESVCRAVKRIFEAGSVKPSDIKAVGVDGQSWSSIVVDRAGDILFNNPIWMDTRAWEICDGIKNEIGEKNIFELCGNPFEPTYTTPKIIWFKKNYGDVFKKAHKILQSNSYIVYKLTREFSQDLSQCYGLHFFDMRNGKWDGDMAKAMGVDLALMPDIVDCHKIVGAVTEQAAIATGLCAGTPVVAGGLDAACGTLGAGVIDDGQTQEQGGQAGGMSICLKNYKAHEKLIMSVHVVPERWLLQGGTVGGGGTLKWLKEKMFSNLSFEQMSGLASALPAGSDGVVFLPYMAGERSPIWDKKAKGVYFGLDYAKNKSHFVRAAMEGVAYALLHNIKTAEEAGAFIKHMNSVGGAANSDVWMQIKSDVSGKPMSVPSSDTAATLGAAVLAGVAVGMYRDFGDAVKHTVKIKKTYEPDMQTHEIYQKYYAVYLELYQNLKMTMNKI